MYPSERRHLRNVRTLHALALFAALFVLPFFGHFVSLLLWLAPCAALLVPKWNRARVIAPLWLLMAGSAFLPFDVSLETRPGPPHFARLVMGLALRREMEAKYHCDVVLGGCSTTGFEPKWVWVW